MPYVGQLQAAGLAKEDTLGTLKTPPTEFLPLIPPDSFSEAIELLESKGIRAQPDVVQKVTQGPASLKSGKVKLELEPENCGNLIMATFGQDSIGETASFVVANTNKYIDFKESGGSQLHAIIATGTYKMGTTSATASTLCKAIKDALEAASGAAGTYIVTYSDSTRKVTIAIGSGTLQILWLTGTNQANGAYSLLGFSHTDTSASASLTSDSTTEYPVFAHTFTRLSNAQLPTYSWWFHKGAKYFQFTGCMMNKAVIDVKAKDMVTFDSDWTALTYDDNGTSQSPTYSTIKPFTFSQAVVKLDGSQINDFENFMLTIDNMVEADHALSGSIYPAKIYTKGMKITFSATLFLEDSTQYAKFLAGTAVHFNVKLTSGELITGSAVPYSLELDLPVTNYASQVLHIENGVMKIHLTGVVVVDTSGSNTPSAILTNSRVTAY